MELLSCLPPMRMIRLQITNCISFLVNLEAYCSFELFLTFQNVSLYIYYYYHHPEHLLFINMDRQKKEDQQTLYNSISKCKKSVTSTAEA